MSNFILILVSVTFAIETQNYFLENIGINDGVNTLENCETKYNNWLFAISCQNSA